MKRASKQRGYKSVLFSVLTITMLLGGLNLTEFSAHSAAAAPQSATNQQPVRLQANQSQAAQWNQFPLITAATLNDRLSQQVSLSSDGSTAIIGEEKEVADSSETNGVAYIFGKTDTGWARATTLTASDTTTSDLFGSVVGLSADGSIAIVGAPQAANQTGAVYIFNKTFSGWVQTAKLTLASNISGAQFGNAVKLSADGSTAIIGALLKTVGNNKYAGAAYIFNKTSTGWTQTAELTEKDNAPDNMFGRNVGLSADGSTALVTATNHNSDGTNQTGVVYIFSKGTAGWTQAARLVSSDSSYDAKLNFGSSEDLSGDGATVIVGDIGQTVGSNTFAGAAYVYSKTSSGWTQTAKISANDNTNSSEFGSGVSLSKDGSVALIGAVYNTMKNSSELGTAYIFTKGNSGWAQTSEFTANASTSNPPEAHFGGLVTLSADGSTALIVATGFGGAKPYLNETQAAYIFTTTATNPNDTVQPQTWRDSGFTLPTQSSFPFSSSCVDTTQPNRILYSDVNVQPVGTYAYNWLTGQKTFISKNDLAKCNGSTLYSINLGQPDASTVYSIANPTGTPIRYYPQDIAPANPQILFNIIYTDSTIKNAGLLISTDGGQTWQNRTPDPNATFISIALASNDGKSIYALATTPVEISTNYITKYNYTLYFSADAGATWQNRYQTSLPAGHDDGFSLEPLAGQNSANFVALLYSQASISPINDLMLSTDGGQTFNDVGQIYNSIKLNLYYTSKGIIREKIDPNNTSYTLARSTDGKTWQNLALSFSPTPTDKSFLIQDPNAPDNLFLSDPINGNLWWSADAGQTWQKAAIGLSNISQLTVLSYSPLTLLAFDTNNKLYLLDGLARTAPVAASTTTGNMFFVETGHNLSGVFLKYWQAHGGLAQFGFPKTEQFKEYNPADGKFYLVQYFERNRFEYHPEFAGSQYEVELGLLGDQQTANRRNEPAFQPVKNPNTAGTMYFSQTEHTLSGKFKDYWNANGGLSIYGYPISEPFQEVNPDDGKTYTVQYFERNRFEYHPEFAGSKYEVELGLLGNTLLKAEGWLK